MAVYQDDGFTGLNMEHPDLQRMLIEEHPNEDFYVMNGNRALIKREKFERYLDQATAV